MEDSNNAQSEWTNSFKSKRDEKCVKELSNNELLSLVIKCANFAAKKHRNQRRKDVDQTPYINHPLGSPYINYFMLVTQVFRTHISFFLSYICDF